MIVDMDSPADIEKKVKQLRDRLLDHKIREGDGTAAARLAAAAAKSEVQRQMRKRKRDDNDNVFGTDDDPQVFGQAPALGSGNAIMKLHLEQPGCLYEKGLEELSRFLSTRVGAGPDSADAQSFLTYLTAVFFGQHPPKELGVKTTAELRTLASCLDSLGRGDLPALGDMLIQRFKALETSIVDNSWSVARRLELVPSETLLATPLERKAPARDELLYSILKETAKPH